MEGEIDSELEFPVELRPTESTMLEFELPPRLVDEKWGWSGGKRLTEICGPFAEQQMRESWCSTHEIIQQIQEEPTESNLDFLRVHKERMFILFEDLQGIIRREEERRARDETEINGMAKELCRKERIVGDLREKQARSESIKKQMEKQIRNLLAQRTRMTDSAKAFKSEMIDSRIDQEIKLRQERVRNEFLVEDLERQRLRNEFTKKMLEATEIREQRLMNENQEAEAELEQSRETAAELSEVIDQLEACRKRAENQESRRAEAEHQLEECQREATDSELEFNRKEKETNRWIMMAALIGGSVMLLMIGIFIFVLCRKAGKGIIEKSEDMKRELGAQRHRRDPLPNGQPGSVAIDIAEMDPRFRCSRDPQVAALNHSILADENGQFGINQIQEVTEQEGIDISAVTRQSTIGNEEEGESVIQAIKKGVKGAVERKQREQMYAEPLKDMMQNAVVVQEEVIDEIVEVMETDKEPEPQPPVDE